MIQRHDDEIDTRTVAEKRGKAVEIVKGKRPPPDGWPAEAFAFPLRRPGPATIAGGAVVWVLLDLVTGWNLLVGMILKLAVAFPFLSWQIQVAARTAAGYDEPPPWGRTLEMRRDRTWAVGRWLVLGVVLLTPSILFQVFDADGIAIALFAVALLFLAVGALGLAIGRTGLMRPWNALLWIGRHPFGLVAATLGWWAAAFVEWAVFAVRHESVGTLLLVSVPARFLFLYLMLLSARALGVVGRDDGEAEATSPSG